MERTPPDDANTADVQEAGVSRKRSVVRRILVVLAVAVGVGVLALAVAGAWAWNEFHASLPRLDGEIVLTGLSAPVVIERDSRGIPTLRAENRLDLAFATGFVHAQDRFFQMDLLRRASAGELAELFGAALVVHDRRIRAHRFRAMAHEIVETATADDRAMLESYARGVNAGLDSLDAPPFEYVVLRDRPAPWLAEDCMLVQMSMYVDLQDEFGRIESSLGVMFDSLPEAFVEFLTPRGTEWDAPVAGDPFEAPPIPGPEVYDLRRLRTRPRTKIVGIRPHEPRMTGSNNWAVSGDLTEHAGALLANDMHLPLRLPNVWYRTSLAWPGDGAEPQRRVTGITLPGVPAMVSGSNGHVAWGYTNSEGDWSDLIILEPDPEDPDGYLTPDGPRRLEVFEEIVRVKNAEDEVVEIMWTIWGPVIDHDHFGRLRVLNWVAHHAKAVNLRLMDMEDARSVGEAIEIANLSGSPAQNFVVADRDGRIGWTIMGAIPRRVGFDGRVPTSWADGSHRWDGWLELDEMPRIAQPPGDRIWTANARVVDGEMLNRIQNRYVLGARARQIRDRLLAADRFNERAFLDIQLDDRAVLLERWRGLLLDILTPEVVDADPARKEFLRLVRDDWDGHASVDSVGFRMTRTFRSFLSQEILDSFTSACVEADDRFRYNGQWEGPLWKIVTERPMHLLDPSYRSWEDRLIEVVDRAIHYHTEDGSNLEDKTWGARNTVTVRHPLSSVLPFLSSWLDMPALELPGDAYMPRVQGPGAGASERMVVSPGREDDGIFHMPGGQSGHPLSPYYGSGHLDWATGEPTPFLPGPAEHTLRLLPKH